MTQKNGAICSSGQLSLVRSGNDFRIVASKEDPASTVIFSSWEELLGICIAIMRSTEVLSRLNGLPAQIQRPYNWLPRLGDQANASHDAAWDEALKEFIPGDVEEFCYQFSPLKIGDIVLHDEDDMLYLLRGGEDKNLDWTADELFQLAALVLSDVRTREVVHGDCDSPYWCPFLLIVVRQLFKLDLSGARRIDWHSPEDPEAEDEDSTEDTLPEANPRTSVPPPEMETHGDDSERLRQILDQHGL